MPSININYINEWKYDIKTFCSCIIEIEALPLGVKSNDVRISILLYLGWGFR